eukprot:GHVU01077262.1.p1 GENE.GHVU01077262.1~~GHVU01077262.1.p1  ORF type:complete len:110 (+),score=4.79 GHVU01077262.1:415-744(+)
MYLVYMNQVCWHRGTIAHRVCTIWGLSSLCDDYGAVAELETAWCLLLRNWALKLDLKYLTSFSTHPPGDCFLLRPTAAIRGVTAEAARGLNADQPEVQDGMLVYELIWV